LRGVPPPRAITARERSADGRVTLGLLAAEGRVLARGRATTDLEAVGTRELERGDRDRKELHK
jgi:hypothetical protein